MCSQMTRSFLASIIKVQVLKASNGLQGEKSMKLTNLKTKTKMYEVECLKVTN